jgi:hypothetical protein
MDMVAVVSLVFSAAFTPLSMSFLVSLGLFILSKIMRGQAKFGQLFSMCMHIYVITAAGALITYVLMSLTGSLVDITSLAAIVSPNGRLDEASHNFFMTIAIFPVWTAIITFIGVKILNDFSSVKAGIATGIVFVATSLVHVVMMMFTWIALDMAMALEAVQ